MPFDTTSAVASVNTALLQGRSLTRVPCILPVPRRVVGPRCPIRRIFAAIAPNSAQLFAESTAIKVRRSRFRHTVAGMPPGGYKQ